IERQRKERGECRPDQMPAGGTLRLQSVDELFARAGETLPVVDRDRVGRAAFDDLKGRPRAVDLQVEIRDAGHGPLPAVLIGAGAQGLKKPQRLRGRDIRWLSRHKDTPPLVVEKV